ncbi:MAG: hypothetical protein HY225_00570 [Candidatus Vogelbacteria bacterium]|nr:hypothetical protein [Candidatus Vogelbacteria bacterium]
MDALKKGAEWLGVAAEYAGMAVGCVASLALVNRLAAPAWDLAKHVASLGDGLVSTGGTGLVCALGLLALGKYLKS